MSPLLALSKGYVLSPYLLDDPSQPMLQADACFFFFFLGYLILDCLTQFLLLFFKPPDPLVAVVMKELTIS